MTITFEGDWLITDRAAAMAGVEALGNAMSEISGIAPEEAFERVVGRVAFEAALSIPGNFYAYVTPGVVDRVKFRIWKVTPWLVVHELGHIINDRVPDHPADHLARYGIKTGDGKLVTGPGAGGYKRHAGRYAPHNGYRMDVYPWMQHPRWWRDGDSALEDWADMVLALVTGNFADNDAGRALRGWIVGYLVGRLID